MPHLRIGIVEGFRPSTTLLAHAMMSRHHPEVLVVVLHSEPRPINTEALALEILRADIPGLQVQSLSDQKLSAPEMSLKEVVSSIKIDQEILLLERDPLPRPPKSIRPKVSPALCPIIRRKVHHSR